MKRTPLQSALLYATILVTLGIILFRPVVRRLVEWRPGSADGRHRLRHDEPL